jgi:hypothetical protein
MSSAIAIAALAWATAVPMQATSWPSSGWFDVTELEDGCVATGEFEFDGRADVRFMLSYDGGDDVMIGFSSYGWSRTDGQTYEIAYLFRPTTAYTGNATGYTTSIYHGFASKFGTEVLDHFAQADSLEVTKDGVTVTHINLRGSAGATATLRRCAAAVRRKVAAQERREQQWEYIAPDPFAPAAPAPVPSDTRPATAPTGPQ